MKSFLMGSVSLLALALAPVVYDASGEWYGLVDEGYPCQ